MYSIIYSSGGEVRNSGIFAGISEVGIEFVMKERIVRGLFLFNQQAIRNVVLGGFGAGVFR